MGYYDENDLWIEGDTTYIFKPGSETETTELDDRASSEQNQETNEDTGEEKEEEKEVKEKKEKSYQGKFEEKKKELLKRAYTKAHRTWAWIER